MERHPRVLIVGTIPYNKNTSSRAFDAYFHRWEKENIRQIFSNTKVPTKGHCETLYQITDQRLVKRWLHKIKEVGVIYHDKNLPVDWENSDLEVGSKTFDFLYKIGSKDSPLKYLARKVLWKKKYWNTPELNKWLEEFQPECVFLAFSDDFFIPEIALYVAEKFNIPIMSCIGDDYYFNDRKSISPFYYLYRKLYKKLIDRVFAHGGSAIYIGDKIRDKYNKEFHLNGETVYLTSDIKRHEYRPIDKENLKVSYCGNVRLERNTSLCDIANALGSINPNYRLDVYSAERNEEFLAPLKECPYIVFHGSVPYTQVEKIMSESDILAIVEGFKKEEVTITKYSLSTKAADSLATGSQIIVYGSLDCGVIEYMKSTESSVVCLEKDKLAESLSSLINDETLQRRLYAHSERISHEHHDMDRNLDLSEKLFKDMIADYGKRKR